MIRLFLILLCSSIYSISVLATTSIDSTTKLRFQNLTDKMRLKMPKLKEGEYQVRIWNKQALRYGDAQMLYVLTKTERKFLVSKYIIDWDGPVFRHAIQLKPTRPVAYTLWDKLLKQDILTLHDQAAIANQLHPQQQKDSTYTSIEKDGSVSVHAKKQEASVYIMDGEGYYFEVFNADKYRGYGYSNPREYSKYKPGIVELQKVIAILNTLAVLFHSTN